MTLRERYDVWTYASSNSVTTPGNLTGTYWPGMKIALKQGTIKYFKIISVTYVSPNTTIILDGMGLYSLTNAAITAHIDTTEYSSKGFPYPQNANSQIYDSSPLRMFSHYKIAWDDPATICEGTYSGYILLAKAHAGGYVPLSEVCGRFILNRGGIRAANRTDVVEVISKSAYNGEYFVANLPLMSGYTFIDKLVKITYGGIVYHAIKLTTTGGYANNGLFFDGYSTETPILIRSDAGSSEVDYGNFGLSVHCDGLITTGNSIYVGENIYVEGDCSALTFTDRTPFYDGDALKEIKKISSKDGKIDHNTLPKTVKADIVVNLEDGTKAIEDGRDLGAMISVLTKAVQQLTEKLEITENEIFLLKNKIE
jgi:hypothetical protein